MPKRWLLVTNHLNLLYMLAAGLIMSPKGFGTKYYQDPLCIYPGWIPLFAEHAPAAAIQQAVSESRHLKPCLLSVNLSLLNGRIKGINADNTVRDIVFPDEAGNSRTLLIPAPLPVIWTDAIIFRSREEKAAILNDAEDFKNVPLTKFRTEVKKNFFTGKSAPAWPLKTADLPNIDRPINAPMAAGAMMAMLLRMANSGAAAREVTRLAFDPDYIIPVELAEPMISAVGEWQRAGQSPTETDDVLKQLFWGAVDSLIADQTGSQRTSDFDLILSYLQTAAAKLEVRLQKPLLKLSNDLKILASFGDSTITELFERHPKSFSRVMTLFFLRENCAALLEFSHPLLKEKDYLAAAILFAARDGWLNLPLELRDFPGLQEAVSHRMAAMAQRMAGSGLDLGTPPPRPKPLIELFAIQGQKEQKWNKKQKEAALFLARDCKWPCIQTTITLGKGKYRMEIDGRGTHIFLDGETTAVTTEVDTKQFLSHLSRQRFTGRQEQKTRLLLKL
ncbi:hypothetical protein MNBD_DELTA03-830 [hydrothermal vent metagenome]|uniref:Uncharacterized protein n=1 Tax=hydrothermal vent metagenome TaxID=652676 RepID=A0A3B0VCZ4_9ZZZZ